MTNTSYGAQSRHPGLVRYLQSLKYALHVIGDPNIKEIPADVVAQTSAIYKECQSKICHN